MNEFLFSTIYFLLYSPLILFLPMTLIKEFLKQIMLISYLFISLFLTYIQETLANLADKNNFLNTTNNIKLNKIFIIIFVIIAVILTYFFYHKLKALINNNNWYFRFLWLFLQSAYFIIGFINCFGTKVHKQTILHTYKDCIMIHYSSPIYAHTHDLFFWTLMYIIINLFLLYVFNAYCTNINVNDRLSEDYISHIIEMMSLIIAVISITLSHHISSVSCMGIIIIIFISVQLGLFGLYPNFIDNNNNN